METKKENYYLMLDKILASVLHITNNKTDSEKLRTYVELGFQAEALNIPDTILPLLHAKLIEDKYLVTDNGKNFAITFKGLIFINHEGGYQKKIKDDNSRNDHLLKSEKLLIRLQILIAIGTSIAALYYLTELCKYYHWNCFFC